MVDPATGEQAYDDTVAMEEAPAGPFDRGGTNDDVTIAVAAQVGLFPAYIAGDEGQRHGVVCFHRQFCVDALDGARNAVSSYPIDYRTLTLAGSEL